MPNWLIINKIELNKSEKKVLLGKNEKQSIPEFDNDHFDCFSFLNWINSKTMLIKQNENNDP